jgi:tetratricopeptide (TPR) repeat protein
MSRTSRYKLLYLLALALLAAIVFGVLVLIGSWPPPATSLLVVAVVLLIPGRINGHFWRDFYRARRLLGEERLAESVDYGERFLDRVRRWPRLKKLIWLQWGIYTRDIEAMTLNNLGAARLMMGDFERARENLQSALELDRLAPLPHFNLAMISKLQADEQAFQDHLQRARELGYKGSSVDALLSRMGQVLAQVEGRGAGSNARDLGD